MEGPGAAVFCITRFFFSLVISLCPGMAVWNCTGSTRISPIIFHDNISRSSSHLQEDLPDVFPHQAHQDKLNTIPGTLDSGRFLRGKMAHIFITKPRQNIGYAYVCFFDLNHFSYHIEPAKPKRPRYHEKQYHDHQRGPARDGLTNDQVPVQGPDR